MAGKINTYGDFLLTFLLILIILLLTIKSNITLLRNSLIQIKSPAFRDKFRALSHHMNLCS
jgi:hypothetical protein